MRIFLAGATGVIGTRLVALLTGSGHAVTGMTRSAEKLDLLRELGATPVLCDVFDADSLVHVVSKAQPDVVVHQLTDLPDDATRIVEFLPRNGRIRGEGTANLLRATAATGASRLVAQSIAWATETVAHYERVILDAGGTVLRYGQFYGPGTYYEDALPPHPRISVDQAAQHTLSYLEGPPGISTLTED